MRFGFNKDMLWELVNKGYHKVTNDKELDEIIFSMMSTVTFNNKKETRGGNHNPMGFNQHKKRGQKSGQNLRSISGQKVGQTSDVNRSIFGQSADIEVEKEVDIEKEAAIEKSKDILNINNKYNNNINNNKYYGVQDNAGMDEYEDVPF